MLERGQILVAMDNQNSRVKIRWKDYAEPQVGVCYVQVIRNRFFIDLKIFILLETFLVQGALKVRDHFCKMLIFDYRSRFLTKFSTRFFYASNKNPSLFFS